MLREDTITDIQRKSIMQLSFVLGLTLGYPLTEKVSQHKIVFWGIAGLIFLLGSVTFLNINGRKLSKHTADLSFKISLMTILFKKVEKGLLRGPLVVFLFYLWQT
jgi:hypothetical protein